MCNHRYTCSMSVIIIAEIGTAHGGSLHKARDLINAAVDAGAISECVLLCQNYSAAYAAARTVDTVSVSFGAFVAVIRYAIRARPGTGTLGYEAVRDIRKRARHKRERQRKYCSLHDCYSSSTCMVAIPL